MSTDSVYVRDDLQPFLDGQDPFSFFSSQPGEEYRALEFRRTYALVLDGKTYFVKYHKGSSLGEILKNWLQLRMPVLSARNEMTALEALSGLGIRVPTVVAYGVRGLSPLSRESFIVTDDIGSQENLEDLTRDWPEKPPTFALKQHLLKTVATIAREMHAQGICHRDFYLCHFMVTGRKDADNGIQLTLLALHRALIKASLGRRWIIKDLAGLYFSAMDIGLTQRDLLRFIALYSDTTLRESLTKDADFWQRVRARAMNMKARHG